MRAVILICATTLLAACSSQPVAGDAWTRWVCDNQTEVLWRPAGDEALDLRLGGDDIVHRLQLQAAASGALYSDPLLAFHTKGGEGLIYRVGSEQVIGRECRAP